MSDSAIVTFALVAAAAGIAYGLYLAMWVFKLNAGNQKMQDIAKAIQEGAGAYMNRQYRTVGIVAAVLFVVLWAAGFASDKFGMLTAIGFLVGAGASAIAGYVGMIIAVRANVRTAQAAHDGMNAAWDAWLDKANAPARATVESRLATPDYLVEIAVVAGA